MRQNTDANAKTGKCSRHANFNQAHTDANAQNRQMRPHFTLRPVHIKTLARIITKPARYVRFTIKILTRIITEPARIVGVIGSCSSSTPAKMPITFCKTAKIETVSTERYPYP